MNNRSISVIATVECQSQTRGEDVPVAIVIAEKRFEIVETHDRAMVTGVDAGGPITHRLWVEISDGRRFEIHRVLPDGPWRVTTFGV